MLLLDKPYVSSFLLDTVQNNDLPVINTGNIEKLLNGRNLEVLNTDDAISLAKSDKKLRFLTNSENSIGWIAKNLPFLDLSEKINLFKNKVLFRELTTELHPDFFFKSVSLNDLDTVDANQLSYPFIIKPAVGFFSMGVHLVTEQNQWNEIREKIHQEIQQTKSLYPLEVFDSEKFIIEQVIEGDEFAIDAYFDDEGKPVILNIFKHIFASEEDVSDRVYVSSKEIIEENLNSFQNYLEKIGNITGVRNFPIHVELRRDEKGTILPIEINPMRFGGWCTTADMTGFCYGFNSYLAYFENRKPDWNEILKDKNGISFAVVVLDNSTGIKENEIRNFDCKKLLSKFENVLEFREIDFQEYPVFGFVFTETAQENFNELTDILTSDLTEFVLTK